MISSRALWTTCVLQWNILLLYPDVLSCESSKYICSQRAKQEEEILHIISLSAVVLFSSFLASPAKEEKVLFFLLIESRLFHSFSSFSPFSIKSCSGQQCNWLNGANQLFSNVSRLHKTILFLTWEEKDMNMKAFCEARNTKYLLVKTYTDVAYACTWVFSRNIWVKKVRRKHVKSYFFCSSSKNLPSRTQVHKYNIYVG